MTEIFMQDSISIYNMNTSIKWSRVNTMEGFEYFQSQINDCLNGKIPHTSWSIFYRDWVRDPSYFPTNYSVRDLIDETIGFCHVHSLFIDALSTFLKNKGPVVELMAGNGFLSNCLMQKNIDIIPTDDFSWKSSWNKLYCDVQNINAADTIKKYQNCEYIICSWPYMDDDFANAIQLLRPDQKLIYIGESRGGCTASDAFFEGVEEIESDESWWKIYSSFDSRYLCHDKPYLYKRK